MNQKNALRMNEQLRMERLQRGWSQQEVANKLGVTVVTVNRWERGVQQPGAYLRLKLCTLFDKTATELGLVQEETEVDTLTTADGEVALRDMEQEKIHAVKELAEKNEGSVQSESNSHKQQQQRSSLLRQRRSLLTWGGVGLTAALAGSGGLVYWFSHRASALLYTYYTAKDAGGVYDVEWSPQGDFIASVNGKHVAEIMSTATEPYHISQRGIAINCLTWSPDGARLATPGPDQMIHIWDPVNNVDALRVACPTMMPECIAWSPDGKQIALGGTQGVVHVWDAKTGALLLVYQGHKGPVWWIAWSKDSRRLASAGADNTVRVWSSNNGQTLLIYTGHKKAVVDVKWSPQDQKIISASEDRTAQIWDAWTGKTLLTYSGHKASVQAAEWSPDGASVASSGVDSTIRIWNVANGKDIGTYTGHTNTVWTLSWSPNGEHLASASADGTVRIWQVSI